MELKESINLNHKFLLVGCDTVKERDALSELWHVLIKHCKITPLGPFELSIRGLVLVAVSEEPIEIIKKINAVIANKLFSFQYCKTFTPIEKILECSLEELGKLLPQYMAKIPNYARWRITINHRHTKLKRNEVIDFIVSLPDVPQGKVDLKNPEWEIIIEIFGKWLGFSIFKID